MKISYSWLKEYLPIDLPESEVAALLTDIGLEVEGIEKFESVKGGLQNLVIGEILTCERHPDADKLKLTTVDIGDYAPLQIVCGAPNAAKGQKVVVAPVGTTIFPVNGEPVKISKTKIRGVESHGMICAEDEIGLGQGHEGIIVLPDDAPVGLSAQKFYRITSDTIFEIGLTPNRSDAFSHLGVARDLRAAISMRGNISLSMEYPDITTFQPGKETAVNITIEDKVACPRYSGLVIDGITIDTSPLWLQDRLRSIGQKPINNVVDITNFILHEYGQPLHAFDLEAIGGNAIVVRKMAKGSKFLALDGVEYSLHEEDLVICDTEKGMCIAGVYGGLNSGVRDSTTAIFLESAFFDPKHIRTTSLRHGLRTEAAQHFEKGIDPNTVTDALKRAALMITDIAGGRVVSPVHDIYDLPIEHRKVFLTFNKVRDLGGAKVSNEEILRALELLEIEVSENDGQLMELSVPPYRADVTRDVDVVEDILRIYGYNNIGQPPMIRFSVPAKAQNSAALRESTSSWLAATGAYEIMTNPLTRSKYFEKLQLDVEPVKLLSSINTELDVLRPYMYFTGLESIALNINHKNPGIVLFEFGKTYSKADDQYHEVETLAIYASGPRFLPNWLSGQQKADIYYLKSLVELFFERLGISGTIAAEKSLSWSDRGLEYSLNDRALARVGALKTEICRLFDIKADVFYAEVEWQAVLRALSNIKHQYVEVNKFPAVRRDVALLLDKQVSFARLEELSQKFGGKSLRSVDLFDVYEGEKIEKNKKSYAISLIFQHRDKTLQDEEVDAVINKLIAIYQQELGAKLR